VPFRPTSIAVHPATQDRLDRIAQDAAEGRQPGQAIWKGLRVALARIKNDGQWGEVIPPDSIPSRFVREFGVTNLYCVDLPSYHRLLYTIRDRDVIILALVSHPEYDRLMKG
jgi:hypothetical protein